MKKIIIFCNFLILLSLNVNAAFLENIPRTLIQPNGDTLHCFVSGDEFYNYLHDAEGYTIVLNKLSGYYVYADKIDNELVPTQYIAGTVDPRTIGLRPFLNISSEQWIEKRNSYFMDMPQQRGNHQLRNFGNLNNIVVFIRFADDTLLTTSFSTVYNMFNDSTAGANSMYNYYKTISYNQIFIQSTFYPAPNDDQILSYQDSHPRNYFLPYSSNNTLGYNDDDERRAREHALLGSAINYIRDSVPSSLNIDYNDDGNVDNVCFVIKGSVADWNELLWPHRWSLYSRNDSINGKRVYDYNFQLEGGSLYFTNSVLSHEMFHSLGAPDLYHYDDENNFKPIDRWDVMGSNTNPPQHPCAYSKYEYGHWIQNIPEITQYGVYTLKPLSSTTSDQTCYKIASSFDPDQYFVLEYRKTSTPFESQLYGSGLVIYRINTNFDGNAGYDGITTFDEVYAFRPNGTINSDGNASTAFFSANSNRTQFNYLSNPYPFLTDGTLDSLYISNITVADSTISFTYGVGNNCYVPTQLQVTTIGDEVTLNWNYALNSNSYMIYRDSVQIASGITSTSYVDSNVSNGSHCYYVAANCVFSSVTYSEQQCTFVGNQAGDCEIMVYMHDNYLDGWNGGSIMATFNDGTANQVIGMYSGEWDTLSLNVGIGTMVSLSWISGEWDSECSFIIAYSDGTLIYESSGTPTAGFITSFTVNCSFGNIDCFVPQNLHATQLDTNIVLTWDRQTDTILDEGFEMSFPADWQRIDGNNDASNWLITSSFTAHSGSRVITSASYTLTPDNWLVTPQLNLGINSYLSFWVCAQDNDYFGEHYAVYISTTDSDTASFTTLLFEETINTSGRQTPWVNRIIDLSNYTGEVYIAFRHFNCTDMYYLNFDDIKVITCPNTSYNVYKNNVLIAQNIDSTFYNDVNYLDGNLCYFITGNCGSSESFASSYACVSFDSGNELNLTATPTQRDITLQWHSTHPALSYSIYRNNLLLLNTIDTSFVDVGLNCETEYCYQVEAHYANYSFMSQVECATTGSVIIQGDTVVIVSCGSYSFGENIFENSGIYSFTLSSNCNCDSLVYLQLTVNDEYLVEEEITVCQDELPYHYLGTTFTEAGEQNPITLQSILGCDSVVIVTLTVLSPQITITGNVEILLGDSTTLTANGANDYIWSTGSETESITVFPSENTTYSVTGTDYFGCTGSESATVIVVASSITENEEDCIIVPNPAQNLISINGDNIEVIEIFNALGKLIFYCEGKDDFLQNINVETYTAGIYFVRITTSSRQVITKKLIIQK